MKIKFKEQEQVTIFVDDIDPKKHIVAAIIKGIPTLAKKRRESGYYVFSILSDCFTCGNSFLFTEEHKSIHELIKDGKNIFGEEIKLEVFENKDWKKALQWLIDNA